MVVTLDYLVTQVVSASVQCSKGFELEQKIRMIACLSVCHKPTIPFALNLTFKSNNNFIICLA